MVLARGDLTIDGEPMARSRTDVEIVVQRNELSSSCYDIVAYLGNQRVGIIEACVRGPKTKGRLQIVWAGVEEEYMRKGIGTALYEAAAGVACSLGLTLASDYVDNLSPFSSGFWHKQNMKDRAFLNRSDAVVPYYEIEEPCSERDLSRPDTRRIPRRCRCKG